MLKISADRVHDGLEIIQNVLDDDDLQMVTEFGCIYVPDALHHLFTSNQVNNLKDLGWFFDPVRDGVRFKFNYEKTADIGNWDPWGDLEQIREDIDQNRSDIDQNTSDISDIFSLLP